MAGGSGSKWLKPDLIAGLLLLGFAALFGFGASRIRVSPLEGNVGAAGLPKLLAAMLAVLALLLIAQTLMGTAGRFVGSRLKGTSEAHGRALVMMLLGAGYILILPFAGYAVSAILLMAAVAVQMKLQGSIRIAAFAGLGGLFFFLLFVKLLNIPLPSGTLWHGLGI